MDAQGANKIEQFLQFSMVIDDEFSIIKILQSILLFIFMGLDFISPINFIMVFLEFNDISIILLLDDFFLDNFEFSKSLFLHSSLLNILRNFGRFFSSSTVHTPIFLNFILI